MYTISTNLYLQGTFEYVHHLMIKEVYQDVKCCFRICSTSDFDFLLCAFWYVSVRV